jgi:protein-disulfide isomerase
MKAKSLLFSFAVAIATFGCGDPKGKVTADSVAGSKPKTSASAAPSAVVVRKLSPFAEAALKELDATKLNDREKEELKLQLGEAMSPCPNVPVPLAQCLAEKRDCKLCAPAGVMLTRAVRGGLPSTEAVSLIGARFDAKNVKEITLGNAPIKGPADAPVTIVEWADFECPFCAAMVPVIDLITERFPGQVRVAYKTYALPGHPHAPEAAYAALAAYRQGKFWEMQRMLFDNQKALEKKDLFKYAREVDVDFTQFKKDFEDAELRQALKEDITYGDSVGVGGTPTLFINGRLVPMEKLAPFYEEFEEWVKLEIVLAGKTPAEGTEKYHSMKKMLMAAAEEEGKSPPPDASASASPSASAAPSAAPASSAAASASASPK